MKLIKMVWEGIQGVLKMIFPAFFVGLGFTLGVLTAMAYWVSLL